MKLKECPFCGGDAEIETEEYGGGSIWVSTVYCVEGCVSMNNQYGDPEETIERWNKRV